MDGAWGGWGGDAYAGGVLVLAVALLLANAVFHLVTWPTFFRRVARDPRARDEAGRATAFLRVHAVLLAIAITLAALSIVAAVALGITAVATA